MSKDIRNLRIRFVIIVILIVTVVLGVIFGSFVDLTKRSFVRIETDFAYEVARNPIRYGRPNASEDAVLPFTVFEVIESADGPIAMGYYGLSDSLVEEGDLNSDQISELITTIYRSAEDTGLISKYNLRYCKQQMIGSSFNYAVVNISGDLATMSALRVRMTMLSLIGILIFAVIACILSKWVVRPVEKAWTQQKQFVSDASHELKTPLTVITTNAELLQSDDLTEAEKSKYVSNIVTVSHQMRGLVEDLLNMARLENLDRSSFERVDYSSVCQDALMQFEPVLFEMGHMINEDIKPDIHVKGNSQRLNQLLTILLDNAGKYSKSGDIDVSLTQQGRNAVLTVSNPSEEMSDQQLKDIFKRFYRTDESRNEKSSYGLGLSIAQSICETHGGKITAEYNDGVISFKASIPAA